jgi:fructokinase
MKKIICFGEVLWDMLPTGKVPGGAPMNVAFHLNQFGWHPKMISKVGDDALGRELLKFLESKNVSTDLIQIDDNASTGTVKVEIDEEGFPSYEMSDPVAYDFLEYNTIIEKEISDIDVLIYGTLAARHKQSRNTLLHLLEHSKYKVFDVNLRIPFYERSVVETLLKEADLVKMNEEELEIFVAWFSLKEGDINQVTQLVKLFNLQGILLTKGAKGAGYFDGKNLYEDPGISIKVQDTIGSGDSFLAGFLSQFLKGKHSEECLKFAGKIGALVATKKGGTPSFSEEEIDNM